MDPLSLVLLSLGRCLWIHCQLMLDLLSFNPLLLDFLSLDLNPLPLDLLLFDVLLGPLSLVLLSLGQFSLD